MSAAPPTMGPTLRDVDGVPAIHLDGSGPASVTLRFWAGSLDETFRTSGVAHLVEHLVMRQLPKRAAQHNASSSPESTDFWVRGNVAAVCDFQASVAAAITRLRVQVAAADLELERGVLSVEDTGGNPAAIPLMERYGLVGPGLAGIPPPALSDVSEAEVMDYVRRFFVRENAVLMVQGPWPDRLSVPLESGTRNVRTLPPHLPGPMPMQRVESGCPLIVAGLRFGVGSVYAATSRIIADRLHERLRTALGHSYAVEPDRTMLTSTDSHASFVIDSAEGKERAVAIETLRELRLLGTIGPTQADLDHDADSFQALLEDPEFGQAVLDTASARVLAGLADPCEDPERALDSLRELRPDDIRTVIRDALDSLVLVHPDEVPLNDLECDGLPLTAAPDCVAGAISGRTLRRRLVGSGAPRGTTLVFNDTALALQIEGLWHSIPYDDVVGVGVDGPDRDVIGRTGCRVFVSPSDFRGAETLVAAVDERVPAALRFAMSHSPE